MIDFNIITLWIFFLICLMWLLSVHGIYVYEPLLMMSEFIFAVTYLLRIAIGKAWIPSAFSITEWGFYYG